MLIAAYTSIPNIKNFSVRLAQSPVMGVVYLDENANGRRNPGEPGIPNVNVTTTDSTGQQYALSSTNGTYSLNNLLTEGFTTIEAELPERYFLTEPGRSEGTSHALYYLYTGEIRANVNFGFAPLNLGAASVSE